MEEISKYLPVDNQFFTEELELLHGVGDICQKVLGGVDFNVQKTFHDGGGDQQGFELPWVLQWLNTQGRRTHI